MPRTLVLQGSQYLCGGLAFAGLWGQLEFSDGGAWWIKAGNLGFIMGEMVGTVGGILWAKFITDGEHET